MGKASRRKRERAEAQEPAPGAEPKPRSRIPYLVLGIALAALLAYLWKSGFHDGEAPPAPRPALQLPDPDTSAMTIPVARAIDQARRAALAVPDSGAAAGRYCQVLHAHWLHDEAAACYATARRLAPRDFRWVYLQAGVEEIRGADGERVVSLFREAIRLAPDFPPLLIRFGDALLRLGSLEQARNAYGQAAALDPELVLAHRGQGQASIQMGDGPAAVIELERAAELAPDDRITQTALARAYAMTGQQDRASEAAARAQQLRGQAGLPDSVYHRIDALRVDPESLRARFADAVREGDHPKALEAAALLEESGAPGPRQQLAQAVKQRANQLAYSGQFDQALLEYRRAAELSPNDPEIQHNWGTVQLRRGELEDAGLHFEEAVRLNPRSADSLYNLGVVLEGLGRREDAVERFRQAALIDPGHPAARRLDELGVRP